MCLSLETFTSIMRTVSSTLVELINSSNNLSQIVSIPDIRITDCDSHSPVLMDLFLSSDACIGRSVLV